MPAVIATGCCERRSPSHATFAQSTKTNAVAPAVATITGARSVAFSSDHPKSHADSATRPATPAAATAIVCARLTGARLPGRYPAERGRAELPVWGGLRDRVPRLPVRLQRGRLRGAGHRGRRQARADCRERARRGRDARPRRAGRRRTHRGAAQRARAVPRPAVGARLARGRRVPRLLVAEAGLPRRLARPARQGGAAGGRVGRCGGGLLLSRPVRRTRAARARAGALVARAAVQALGRLNPT